MCEERDPPENSAQYAKRVWLIQGSTIAISGQSEEVSTSLRELNCLDQAVPIRSIAVITWGRTYADPVGRSEVTLLPKPNRMAICGGSHFVGFDAIGCFVPFGGTLKPRS